MRNKLKILIPAALLIIAGSLFWPQGRYFITATILLFITVLLWPQGRYLFVRAAAVFLPSPTLSDQGMESSSVIWYDDYFTIEYIDSTTIAIGEPRYHQRNYSYLIIGNTLAILFDTGPGIRDIRPVVESLTTLPVVVSQSHLHYDHIGNHNKFDGAAFPDLPQLRKRSKSGMIQVSPKEHLGFVEKINAPNLKVSDWWALDSPIDLGNRTITVIHTPGHTADSISLFDRDRKFLFTGDFICPCPNVVMTPGANLDDYLKTTRHLLDIVPKETRLLTSHRDKASEPFGASVLKYADLVDLGNAVEQIIAGKLKGNGYFIYSYPINEKIKLIIDK